ncbi:MAG TPA: FAD-dependent monooxygenase [Gemmataceae bacterium]|nr:FAD-dependent monooxygenase [Gemmataceae bacterium]
MTIDPTVDLSAAARQIWDVIVVGAGPAGSMSAREVARRGARVLLVDRATFPRFKVCGGCLNPRSLQVLQRIGLGHVVKNLGAVPLTRFTLASHSQHARLPLPLGAAVSREAFDSTLIREAIKTGVAFLPGVSASLLPVHGSSTRRTVRLRQANHESSVEGRVILAANGLAGALEEHSQAVTTWTSGSRIGAGVMIAKPVPGYEPGTIYMACGRSGYVGQAMVEDGRVDMAAALDPIAVKQAGGIGMLAESILREAGFPPYPNLSDLHWKGTPHLTRRAPSLGGHRHFVVGDAAGYIEPFTGEGMAWALEGAVLVAPLAHRGIVQWDPALLNRWRGAYRRHVTHRQFVCRLTAALLRLPITTRLMVGTLAVAPWIARPFLSVMYRG